jgi:hypothetical protein
MALATHRNFHPMPVRELYQLHDIFNRAGLEHGGRQLMHDVSKVICGRLPGNIIEEKCPAEIREIIAK